MRAMERSVRTPRQAMVRRPRGRPSTCRSAGVGAREWRGVLILSLGVGTFSVFRFFGFSVFRYFWRRAARKVLNEVEWSNGRMVE